MLRPFALASILMILAATACAEAPLSDGADASQPEGSALQTASVEAGLSSSLCGGPADLTCGAGMICERHTGQCDSGWGICRPVPTKCARKWAPVCGCDGKTYASDCARRKATTGKAAAGVCPKPTGAFGQACKANQDCDSGWCIETAKGKLCTENCIDSCPKGWTCMVAQGVVPDLIFICQPTPVLCEFDMTPVDTDGDGLPDDCAPACSTACDCYGKGFSFPSPCPLACATCDNYWSCSKGACVAGCGPVPAATQKCLGGQQGDPCGGDAGPCVEGLACCYPCGIQGCQNKCAVPCDDPWCSGGCPMLP